MNILSIFIFGDIDHPYPYHKKNSALSQNVNVCMYHTKKFLTKNCMVQRARTTVHHAGKQSTNINT